MRSYIRFAIYLLVVLASHPSFGGAYDDFFTAVRRDDASAVTELLRRGFDPNSHDPDGQTGLTLAARDRSWRVAAALLASPQLDVNTLNTSGESPLMLAALRGEKDWCLKLLARGAKVQIPGWSPVHYAASGPNSEVVGLMLERGAEPDAMSPNGTTPLMLAARYGSEASVDVLLKRGADPTKRNERGLTASDFARLAGRDALADRLIRR
jgi:ankyrin repeat protein